jgi:hypothetical protein
MPRPSHLGHDTTQRLIHDGLNEAHRIRLAIGGEWTQLRN